MTVVAKTARLAKLAVFVPTLWSNVHDSAADLVDSVKPDRCGACLLSPLITTRIHLSLTYRTAEASHEPQRRAVVHSRL